MIRMNLSTTKYLCVGNETSQIKICNNYKYLRVRIHKDGWNEQKTTERIGRRQKATNMQTMVGRLRKHP